MDNDSPFWILQLIGRLHPMIVHFPIGLLLVALFLELLTIKGKKDLRDGITWLVNLGAISAVSAAVMGLLLSKLDDYGGELVWNHQNFGLATALASLVTAILLHRASKHHHPNYKGYRISLFITCIVLTITGHLGASLTHGEDFLTSVLPGNEDFYESSKTGALLAEVSKTDSLSLKQLDRISLEVRAIFAHNCYQCHSEEKHKGELSLDSKDGVFKGGESGPVLVIGKSDQSEMIRRISLPKSHDEVMPKKGKILSGAEINLISWWIDHGAHWVDGDIKIFPEAPLALSKPDLPPAGSKYSHPVDRLITAYFEDHNIPWPAIVDDQTFIQRAYMDVIGLLPTPETIESFNESKSPSKRGELIQSLLRDDHNYSQHWLSFWNDLLRNDYSGPGFITGGRTQITDWLYGSLLANKPYHQMVRELTNPTEDSEGFIKGIQWRGAVNASQTTAMQAAQNIGQSLMGVNVKCASCHNSFVSNLTLDQTYAFANIFSDSTLELFRCDKPTGRTAKLEFIYPELGSVEADSLKDRLKMLSENITKPENGRLYRTIVNRIWERLNGRGIVEPLDEMDNPPWDPDLLDWLAADFRDHGYNLKYLIENIMTSKAYQLPTVGYKSPQAIKSEKYVYKGPLIRRLSAEQFTDAISQVITPVYSSVAFDPSGEDFDFSRIWHREIEFGRDVLPKPGKRYFRKAFRVLNQPIRSAKMLVSVDHAYDLYINSKLAASGSDWRKIEKRDVDSLLVKGNNIIAIEGENEGPIPNPAGILLMLKIEYADGRVDTIRSDKQWKSTGESVKEGWVTKKYDDAEWEQVKSFNAAAWGKMVHFNFDENQTPFARASLVKLDPFMKALGRPTRENVTTTREEQASLLQALELTNGEFFNDILLEGARNWLKKYGPDSETIATNLYLKCLGRKPNEEENEIILNTLGDHPDEAAIQDLFWATFLLPEFQFIN